MKIKDLKDRITPGTQLVLVNSWIGPCRLPRTVCSTRSRDFIMSGPTAKGQHLNRIFCNWPKKGQLVETPKGFQIISDDPNKYVEYEWVNNSSMVATG